MFKKVFDEVVSFFVVLLVIYSIGLVFLWLAWKGDGEGFVDRSIIDECKVFYAFITGFHRDWWLGSLFLFCLMYLGSFFNPNSGGN
jgi:hypothetical protein